MQSCHRTRPAYHRAPSPGLRLPLLCPRPRAIRPPVANGVYLRGGGPRVGYRLAYGTRQQRRSRLAPAPTLMGLWECDCKKSLSRHAGVDWRILARRGGRGSGTARMRRRTIDQHRISGRQSEVQALDMKVLGGGWFGCSHSTPQWCCRSGGRGSATTRAATQ